MSKTHPDQVLAELKAQCKSTRAQYNLDAVHLVCREASASDKNYSLSVLGRKLEAKRALGQKVPAANTLNSKKGQHFRDLIRAWAAWDGVSVVRAPSSTGEDTDDQRLLAGIPNQVVREKIGLRLADLKRLRAENNALKAATNVTVDMRRIVQTDQPQVIEAGAVLLPEERNAVMSVLEPAWLKRNGWKEGTLGSVVRIQGDPRPIFPTGFLSAIRKLVGEQKLSG